MTHPSPIRLKDRTDDVLIVKFPSLLTQVNISTKLMIAMEDSVLVLDSKYSLEEGPSIPERNSSTM